MDVLWAPWRMAYIGGTAPTRGCIFCNALTDDARKGLLLGVTPGAMVMLNRYPYASGHLMIAPRRHTADLPGLAADEHADLAGQLGEEVAANGCPACQALSVSPAGVPAWIHA